AAAQHLGQTALHTRRARGAFAHLLPLVRFAHGPAGLPSLLAGIPGSLHARLDGHRTRGFSAATYRIRCLRVWWSPCTSVSATRPTSVRGRVRAAGHGSRTNPASWRPSCTSTCRGSRGRRETP